MEDELNDLLIKAQENISDSVDKQTEFNYRRVLDESMKELHNLKITNQEFIDIRNVAIKNLYGIGYSAQELAEITNLTRQMIHIIIKKGK
jgi:DNA-binding MarR family transcriptional regulator